MATTEHPIVVGVFRERALAKQAVEELRHRGFRDDEIDTWMDGRAVRGGGFIDHIASTFTGHEAAKNSLSDELVSKGLHEDEADYYQQELDNDRTVVAVESYGHQQEARAILYRFGAYDNSSHQADGDRIIPVLEEELRVQKQLVPTGEIVVRKEIITENKTITVPVTREELVIERRPGSAQPTDQTLDESELTDEVLRVGGTLRIILYEEQVRVEKQTVVKEEIVISKRQILETTHVEETVRREEAHLERVGKVNVQGSKVEDVSREADREV